MNYALNLLSNQQATHHIMESVQRSSSIINIPLASSTVKIIETGDKSTRPTVTEKLRVGYTFILNPTQGKFEQLTFSAYTQSARFILTKTSNISTNKNQATSNYRDHCFSDIV